MDTVDTKRAGSMLGVSAKTLRNWRHAGKGPPWMKRGYRTIVYPVEPLKEWRDARYENHGIRPVDSNAYAAEIIKEGYRALSRKHHPDHGGDLEAMKAVNLAKEDLDRALGHAP